MKGSEEWSIQVMMYPEFSSKIYYEMIRMMFAKTNGSDHSMTRSTVTMSPDRDREHR